MPLSLVASVASGTTRANVAVINCAASGHARALDIDCRDPEIAERVKQLALEILGDTPFIRVGQSPKVMLIYRQEEGEDPLQKWGVTLLSEDGEPDVDEYGKPINAVEFLGEGGIWTAYGLHHKTGRHFDWSGGTLHPAIAGPENAPAVDKYKLRLFLKRLRGIRPLDGGPAAQSNPAGGNNTDFSEFKSIQAMDSKLWIPSVYKGPWSENDKGHIVDGAESWLTSFTWALCAANAHLLIRRYPFVEEAAQMYAKDKLLHTHRTNSALSSAEGIDRSAAQKLRTAADKWIESMRQYEQTGRYKDGLIPWQILDDGRRPHAQHIGRIAKPADGSLDWLPEDSIVPELSDHKPRAKIIECKKSDEEVAADAGIRALIEDADKRIELTDSVSRRIHATVERFTANIDDGLPSLHVLRAPTGSGKTVKTVRGLGAWCKDHPRFTDAGDAGPVIVCLPTHANISEALSTAQRDGMIVPESELSDEDIDALADRMTSIGVKATVFKGRVTAGCHRTDEMKRLAEAGIGASRLCGAKVDAVDELTARQMRRNGEKVPQQEEECPFRGDCGYWKQMSEIKSADIVFLPHAYLTLHSIPKPLKTARAVVVDESIVYQVLNWTSFPLATLDSDRPEPHVTKGDRQKWPGKDDDAIAVGYIQSRREAAEIVSKALNAASCPAQALRKIDGGLEMIEDAIVVCSRAKELTRKVRPSLSAAAVKQLAETPTGKHLIEEERFWRTLKERVEHIDAGIAQGDHDMRIQLVEVPGDIEPEKFYIRLSWRKSLNWEESPTLLLDASASAAITKKLFGRDPEIHEIDAPLHVRTVAGISRTFSNRSFLPPADADDDEKKRAAENIKEARDC